MSDSRGFEPRRVASALRRQVETRKADQNEWDVVTRITESLIRPMVAAHGANDVLSWLIGAKDDPYIAAILTNLSGESAHRLDDDHVFRMSDIFSIDEIVKAAEGFLLASPDADLGDGEWAWTALWNGWDQLDDESHFEAVVELIRRVPWDDRVFWMIGDGPLSTIASKASWLAKLDEQHDLRPKLERIWELVEADWPHGLPPRSSGRRQA